LPQRVINEQPDKLSVQKEIAALLERVVMLYQIPNWGAKNAILLSEWIMDNYKFETLETIKVCLKNPPVTGEKNWRLTPDTIREWFAIELEAQAERLEQEHSKRKEEEMNQRSALEIAPIEITDETNRLVNEYLNSIKNIEIKSVRPMTEEEIKAEGQPDFDSYKAWKKRNGY